MGLLCSRKSQVLAFEAIIGIGIFMSAVILLNTSVFSKVNERGSKAEMNNLYASVVYATDTLLKTPGSPEDWNETNYDQIGLEKQSFVVSQNKLENMMSIDEHEIADTLGLSGYNIFFNITNCFNHTSRVSYEKGTKSTNPYILVPIKRIFLLENSTHRIPCQIKMEVWR